MHPQGAQILLSPGAQTDQCIRTLPCTPKSPLLWLSKVNYCFCWTLCHLPIARTRQHRRVGTHRAPVPHTQTQHGLGDLSIVCTGHGRASAVQALRVLISARSTPIERVLTSAASLWAALLTSGRLQLFLTQVGHSLHARANVYRSLMQHHSTRASTHAHTQASIHSLKAHANLTRTILPDVSLPHVDPTKWQPPAQWL